MSTTVHTGLGPRARAPGKAWAAAWLGCSAAARPHLAAWHAAAAMRPFHRLALPPLGRAGRRRAISGAAAMAGPAAAGAASGGGSVGAVAGLHVQAAGRAMGEQRGRAEGGNGWRSCKWKRASVGWHQRRPPVRGRRSTAGHLTGLQECFMHVISRLAWSAGKDGPPSRASAGPRHGARSGVYGGDAVQRPTGQAARARRRARRHGCHSCCVPRGGGLGAPGRSCGLVPGGPGPYCSCGRFPRSPGILAARRTRSQNVRVAGAPGARPG